MNGIEAIEAYPLSWPSGWVRTPAYKRERSRFKSELATARDGLLLELRRLGASSPKISSNIPTRNDGLPYARHSQPNDPGVAVYFVLHGKQMSFACDRFDSAAHNLHAIYLTIDAIRGIERWGASSMLERAFMGFLALPPPTVSRPFYEVLSVPQGASLAVARGARNALLRKYHPDNGETPNGEKTAEINAAYAEAERILK